VERLGVQSSQHRLDACIGVKVSSSSPLPACFEVVIQFVKRFGLACSALAGNLDVLEKRQLVVANGSGKGGIDIGVKVSSSSPLPACFEVVIQFVKYK
jgi:hypothetical protein